MDKLYELYFTVYIVQLVATQLQLSQNNLFSTTMQLHHNYTYDVMMTSLIIIHLLKSNMWHYGNFWTLFFFEILISIVNYDC
jgi:hypothetical protein